MTATTTTRNTDFAGLIPTRVTLDMAANELVLKGTIVCVNASGQAVAGVDGEGFNAVGKASALYDNRTTAPAGGAAGAVEAEVECGIYGWLSTGTAPVMGDVVYVVDNQTVSTSSDSGARGIAGYVIEVVGSYTYVWMGPHVVAQIQQLQTVPGIIPVPLGTMRVASTGAAIPAFADGTADGFEYTDSESLGLRFNVGSTTAMGACVALPSDLDPASDIVVHVLGFRVGAADPTAVVTVEAFFQTLGAANSADVDAGGDTTPFDAATTVVSEETLTIAAANIAAASGGLSLTIVPDAALDADDLVILAMWITYTRA